MQKQNIIQIKNITKSFKTKEVIKNCSLSIQEGSIYSLLGINGAGKTTLFKLLMGLLNPEMGTIEILNSNMLKNRDTMLSQIGGFIESPIFYEHLSAHENLALHLAYMNTAGMSIKKALNMVGLSHVGKQPVSTFSLGMRQRLGIARAMIHEPKLLIRDEPINGHDPIGIKQMRELFVTLSQEKNMTILISSHILSEVKHIADTVGIMSEGKILHEIDSKQIKSKYQGNLEEYFFSLMTGEKQR